MKNKLLKLSLLYSLFLCSCNNQLPYPTYEDLSFENNDTTMYIASDTHYLASSYLDSNRDYDGELFVTDGRTMNYNNILFFYKVKVNRFNKAFTINNLTLF